jgi:hypothetical protein
LSRGFAPLAVGIAAMRMPSTWFRSCGDLITKAEK